VNIITLRCPECGTKILISNPNEGRIIKCRCGAELKLIREKETKSNPGFLELIGAYVLGGLTLGAFLWTSIGREMAISAIQKGAGVTRAKVGEWLKKGAK